ncbi:hypothetical protein OEB94_00430 [Streptomyces sp. ICN988]|uniref:hypothetical protein n=1 Tax=Streptomyces sp. ICN988 TaxID=2983765 RepID=UPI0021E4CBF5|nr:hypothetical protein [Streptomyces sp. ICN988]MCV2457770.1 hypothetical protein [Streptomyces sp. ICN988]
MSATEPAPAPIYDRLIAERGDAVAAAFTAEQTARQAADAFGFSRSATELSEDLEIEADQPDTDSQA